jgi:hypothetical protein
VGPANTFETRRKGGNGGEKKWGRRNGGRKIGSSIIDPSVHRRRGLSSDRVIDPSGNRKKTRVEEAFKITNLLTYEITNFPPFPPFLRVSKVFA